MWGENVSVAWLALPITVSGVPNPTRRCYRRLSSGRVAAGDREVIAECLLHDLSQILTRADDDRAKQAEKQAASGSHGCFAWQQTGFAHGRRRRHASEHRTDAAHVRRFPAVSGRWETARAHRRGAFRDALAKLAPSGTARPLAR